MTKIAVAVSAMIGLGATLTVAETIELRPAKDNTLYEDAAGRFSNGAGRHLFAGMTAGNSIRRGLVAFDVAAALPTGATVESVELTLHVSKSISGMTNVELRKLLADWGEGDSDAPLEEGAGIAAAVDDVTWTHAFFDGTPWERPGGVFAETAGSIQAIGGVGFYTWESTAQLVSDVQDWLDEPAANFGWVVLGNEESSRTTKRFDTREHANADVWPLLRIEFATPPTAVAPRTWGSVKTD